MTNTCTRCSVFLVALIALTSSFSSFANPETTRKLAEDLASEHNYPGAAIEYRRLALGLQKPEDRSVYYWAAAYQYLQSNDTDLLDKMLDYAEDASRQFTAEILLLRAEAAYRADLLDEAAFFMDTIIRKPPNDEFETFTRRRLASTRVAQKDLDSARAALKNTPNSENAFAAIDHYQARRDKRPWLGGLFGVIPGMGYAYSGEYANAVRSLILNGIFIYGMVDTAEDENWGVFTAISFFELTWYTGSIYGGIDSAHRYNQNRLQTCRDVIDGSAQFSPDLGRLPILFLRFDF